MISVHDKPRDKRRRPDAPRLLAVFSYRYDAHLVPALLENIESLVDGWVCFDDRAGEGLFSDEPARRLALLEAARAAGAAWVLAIDPDERIETLLGFFIDQLLAVDGPIAYSFAVRELYEPLRYRTDGVWGRKRQARLLRLSETLSPASSPLHSSWHSMIPGAQVVDTAFNLYHLKMIAPIRRRRRAELYRCLDPQARSQAIGYGYLEDERGAEFESVPPGRGYQPAHIDDGGTWMPEPVVPANVGEPSGADEDSDSALVPARPVQCVGNFRLVAEQRFTHVVPLGRSCRVTYQLRSHFGSSEAYPFDWWTSPMSGVLRYLVAPDPERLFSVGALEELRVDGRIQSIVNMEYGFSFYHEFPRVEVVGAGRVVVSDWRSHLAAARERHLRRLDRLLRLDGPDNRILFVRHGSDPQMADSDIAAEVAELERVLDRGWASAQTSLLLVGFPAGFTAAGNRILQMSIDDLSGPPDEAWRGDDAEWRAALTALGLTSDVQSAGGLRSPPSPAEKD